MSQSAVNVNWTRNVSVMLGRTVLQHLWGLLGEESGITQWSCWPPGLMNKCWPASLQTQHSLQLLFEKVISRFLLNDFSMAPGWSQWKMDLRQVGAELCLGKCWCYQNLIIPCNGGAMNCVACINLYLLCIHLFPSIYLPALKRPLLSTFWGILFNSL